MAMIIEGKIWRFGNEIDTDELFAGRFIMVGNERDPEAYRKSVMRSAFESLSTIGKGNENVPEGFLNLVEQVVVGHEKGDVGDREAMTGNIVVAGENFGIGSSRQQAPEALRFFGISACLAESIHRIFFRNFWNLGGVAIDQAGVSSLFETGDIARIDLDRQLVTNLSNGEVIELKMKLPPEFMDMFKAGGLIPYHKNR